MGERTFRLKTMVVARLLAEMSAATVMALLPLGYLFVADMRALPLPMKVMLGGVTLAALVALPCYVSMTWRVRIDEKGITTYALTGRQFVAWDAVERLQLRSTLHWRRYVVVHAGGELTFPVWLEGGKELCEAIRARLPARPGACRPTRYRQDALGLFFRFVRVSLSAAFVAVFWAFYRSLSASPTTAATDANLVLFVGVALTLLIGWRSWVVVFAPRDVELTADALVVRTCFAERRLPWAEVLKLTPAFFLLPDGFMLKTRRGSYLIGDNLDDSDELVETLTERLEAPR